MFVFVFLFYFGTPFMLKRINLQAHSNKKVYNVRCLMLFRIKDKQFEHVSMHLSILSLLQSAESDYKANIL